MKPRVQDITGVRFGMLVVQARAGSIGKRAAWLCKCDCGRTSTTLGKYLHSGETTSCGCRKRAVLGESCTTHGKFGTPEYWVWNAMIQRCTNPNNKGYKHYGGRGITVCKRWSSFSNFISDMGTRPSDKHTIERKNNNRGYSPSNCSWELGHAQARNKRNTLFVDGTPLVDWAKQNKIPYGTAYARFRKHKLE
jgi:hypothetical protein